MTPREKREEVTCRRQQKEEGVRREIKGTSYANMGKLVRIRARKTMETNHRAFLQTLNFEACYLIVEAEIHIEKKIHTSFSPSPQLFQILSCRG